jgi:uncharacterized protein
MEPLKIIRKYFLPGSVAFEILVEHSRAVMEMAVMIAERLDDLKPDLAFIREAAMVHDIGIVFTREPRIGCHGTEPYICHGYLGRQLLEYEGFPVHALVCERHIGTGLSIWDIESQDLPLPKRDMRPISIEEKIICYADKFYSKRIGRGKAGKSVAEIRRGLEKSGIGKVHAFDEMHMLFSKRLPQEKDREKAQ